MGHPTLPTLNSSDFGLCVRIALENACEFVATLGYLGRGAGLVMRCEA
jgi:hypothetical protein